MLTVFVDSTLIEKKIEVLQRRLTLQLKNCLVHTAWLRKNFTSRETFCTYLNYGVVQ